MTDIEWAIPPPPGSPPGVGSRGERGGRWAGFAAELRRRPGEWAVLPDDSTVLDQAASRIKKGVRADFRPEGAFEAVVRTVEGERRLYVRYVGDDHEGKRMELGE